jgi:Inner membrane protein YgaP-like, transmembrane domain
MALAKNMGNTDRLIRAIVAVVIVVLYATGRIGGTLAIVLGIIALAFLVSSFISWCPSYLPLGISTRKDSSGTGKT